MNKYIPADKLIAEIERRMEMHRKASASGYIIDPNRLDEDEDILSFVDTLQQEQPEVDLEKEIDDWYNTMGIPVTADALKETARHFAEWGATHLNARKEE